MVLEVCFYRADCSDKETGEQNAMRVDLNVSAFINLLCEFVSRSSFASACEYCISSLGIFVIFEHPVQILFRVHLVSVIKCY